LLPSAAVALLATVPAPALPLLLGSGRFHNRNCWSQLLVM
jgi:hypothetical protein